MVLDNKAISIGALLQVRTEVAAQRISAGWSAGRVCGRGV